MKRFTCIGAVAITLLASNVVAQPVDSTWPQFQMDDHKAGTNAVPLNLSINSWTLNSFTGSASDERATPVLTGGDFISPVSGYQGWMLYGTGDGVLQGRSFGPTQFAWSNPDLGSAIKSTPAVAHDLNYDHVFVGNEDGVLYWLSQTGTVVKSLNLGSPVRGPIAIREVSSGLFGNVSAHIYATCANGNIVKAIASYGSFATPQFVVDWTYQNGSPVEGVTVGSLNNLIYFMDGQNRLRAINDNTALGLLDGTLAWSRQMDVSGEFKTSRVPVLGPELVIGWSGRRVYAYDALLGLPVWNREVYPAYTNRNYIIGALADGSDLIVGAARGLVRLNVLTGSPEILPFSSIGFRPIDNMHSYPVKIGDQYVVIAQAGSSTKFYSWDGENFTLGVFLIPWATSKARGFATGYGAWNGSTGQARPAMFYALDDGRAGRIQQP